MSKSKTERAKIDVIINGETANKSIRDLEAAARKAKAELRGMTPDNKEYERYKNSLEKINAELEKSKVNAGLAASAWSKMKQEIKTTFIGNLGANLATLGFQKIAMYFTDAWDSAKKLSDQMADVRKTTGMTTEEVTALRSELSKIDTRTSMSDLMDIAKVGGQFGVAKDQIADFVKAVDRTTIALGDEFSGGAEEVASVMSKLRNVFTDIKSDNIGTDIGFISNAINELSAAGVATGPVVADFANRIGGVGISLGLTSGEVLGLSATLQELGVSTERGGTAVVKIIQKMLTETASFAEIAGMGVGEFEKLLNTDLFGAFSKVMEGSKNLGNNSTALAGIIKDLEVQGAGASEVFAKLGNNMGMLQEKVNMASGALGNMDSITKEANLKNQNFAGSVERLGKEWNKLTANPAIVNFFQFLVDTLQHGITRMRFYADGIGNLWNIMTKGYEEAERLRTEAEKNAMKSKIEEHYKEKLAGRLNEYKQHLQKMNATDLQAEVNKKQLALKQQVELVRNLRERGETEKAAIEFRNAQTLQAELRAAKQILSLKSQQSTETVRMTEEERKKLEKEQEKLAKNKLKEAEKAHQAEYKAIMKHYDELIAEARRQASKEMEVFFKKERDKFDAINDFYTKEFQAILDLDVARATNDEQRYAAEKQRLEQTALDKLSKVKEGSAQYLLIEEQLKNDLEALDMQRNQNRLQRVQEYASSVTMVTGQLQQFMQAQYDVDMNSFRRYQNQKKAALKDQLDNGKISHEVYNAEIAKLDAESEEKERKAKVKSAELQKNFAMFESAIKVALAWVEAYINPTKIPQAFAATAQAALIAAMPIPQFYEGGYMPKSSDDKTAFPIIAHANEYMINAKSMRDPYVMNTVNVIETAKAKGMAPSEVAGEGGGSTNNANLAAAVAKLEAAVAKLDKTAGSGLRAYVLFEEQEIVELEKKNKILIDKGVPGIGTSAIDDLIDGTMGKEMNRGGLLTLAKRSWEKNV